MTFLSLIFFSYFFNVFLIFWFEFLIRFQLLFYNFFKWCYLSSPFPYWSKSGTRIRRRSLSYSETLTKKNIIIFIIFYLKCCEGAGDIFSLFVILALLRYCKILLDDLILILWILSSNIFFDFLDLWISYLSKQCSNILINNDYLLNFLMGFNIIVQMILNYFSLGIIIYLELIFILNI